MIRSAIYLNGYVHEDLSITENRLHNAYTSHNKAVNWVREQSNPSDYFIVKQRYDRESGDWETIEGTEQLF